MVLGLLFESARAMLFLLYSVKRVSRFHAKTGQVLAGLLLAD